MNVWNNAVELTARVAEDTEFDPNQVTPGLEGFAMTGLLALAVIGLGFVLVRRMRKNAYRHEVLDQIEAELAEEAEAGSVETGSDEPGSEETGSGETGTLGADEPGSDEPGTLGADDPAQK